MVISHRHCHQPIQMSVFWLGGFFGGKWFVAGLNADLLNTIIVTWSLLSIIANYRVEVSPWIVRVIFQELLLHYDNWYSSAKSRKMNEGRFWWLWGIGVTVTIYSGACMRSCIFCKREALDYGKVSRTQIWKFTQISSSMLIVNCIICNGEDNCQTHSLIPSGCCWCCEL